MKNKIIQKNPLKIFLCERIPSENRGEAAILEGLVDGLNTHFPPYEIVIYSVQPEKDHAYYSRYGRIAQFPVNKNERVAKLFLSVKLFVSALVKGLTGFSISFSDKLFSEFFNADILLQGHDNIYRYEIKLKDVLVVFFARRYKKKIMIPAGSIGPFERLSRLKKIISLYVLNNVDLITLRDKYSGEFIKKLGVNKVYFELADLAFLLKPEPIPLPWKSDRPILGFTPTNFVFENLKINGTTCTIDKIIDEITEYVKWLSISMGFQVILIPHVYGPEKIQDDRIIIKQIVEKLYSNKRYETITALFDKEYSAGELKYLIGQLHILIACRTHSMIAALGQGVPVIALTEKRRYKTNGTLGDLFNLPECLYYVDDWNLNELKKMTANLFDKRDEIKIRIESQINKVVSLAEKNIEIMKTLL